MVELLSGREREQSLWPLIEHVNQMLESEIVKILEPLDLTIELLKVLYLVDECDGGTIGDLQAASNLDPDRVAASVRGLQLRGLVTRPKPKEDPSATVIRFTTEGRMKVRRAHAGIERLQARAEGWLGVHREPLLAALRRLALLPPLPGD